MIGMDLVGILEEWHGFSRFSCGSQKPAEPQVGVKIRGIVLERGTQRRFTFSGRRGRGAVQRTYS